MRALVRRGGGFTLVEVLVALAIVVVGLAALFNVASQTVRSSAYLREKMLAEWIALNKLTETRVSGTVPAQAKSEGEIEYANLQWRWELEKVSTPVEGIVRLESRVALAQAREGSWTAHATGFMGSALTLPAGATAGGLDWSGVRSARQGRGQDQQGGMTPDHGEGHGPPAQPAPEPTPPPDQDPVEDPGQPQQ
ncbi:MAG TPA: type II secretion system minor pseudopilin GspI [Steroidobacteraceae bacterium]|nr:type II secretion system minor pseudopilin GspI [Steroidobacteraceae bacterium]